MQKIDRLGWAAGMCGVTYGRRIGIRVNQPQILSRIPDLLPPGWTTTSSAVVDRVYSLIIGGVGARPGLRRLNLLYADAERLARTSEPNAIFEALESDLHLHVAATARHRLFVHAGVVGWRGRAIVIPGHSFSGKTTLVTELVRRGATYYSDEYAVLDGHGFAHPFPRSLSLRSPKGEPIGRCQVETLGGVVGVQPLPVGLVLITRYKAGARWRPRPLSMGHAVLALFSNTVPARRQPRFAFATLSRALTHALVLKGGRGEAAAMADSVLDRAGAWVDAAEREHGHTGHERRV